MSNKSSARLCLVCRKTGLKTSLLRFVKNPTRDYVIRNNELALEPDFTGSKVGRGVYSHLACLGRAKAGLLIALGLSQELDKRQRKELFKSVSKIDKVFEGLLISEAQDYIDLNCKGSQDLLSSSLVKRSIEDKIRCILELGK